MEEVPRRTSLVPLASPGFVPCLLGVETEGLLDYQGSAGIISIVQWNFRPVIFGVDLLEILESTLFQPQTLPLVSFESVFSRFLVGFVIFKLKLTKNWPNIDPKSTPCKVFDRSVQLIRGDGLWLK